MLLMHLLSVAERLPVVPDMQQWKLSFDWFDNRDRLGCVEK